VPRDLGSEVVGCEREDTRLDRQILEENRFDALAGFSGRDPDLVGDPHRDVVLELRAERAGSAGIEIRLVLDRDDSLEPVRIGTLASDLDAIAVLSGCEDAPIVGAVDRLADVAPRIAGMGSASR